MRYVKSIEKVTGLFLSESAFLVSDKNEVRQYNFEGNLLWVKELSSNIMKCSVGEEKTYVEITDKETGFEKTIVMHLKDGEIVDGVLSNYMIRSISDDGNAIGLKYNPDYSTKTFCIQLHNEKIIWEKELENLPIFLGENILISGFKKSISSIDEEGFISWKYDTSGLGLWNNYDGKEKDSEVSRILGAHEDKIYLYLNSGKVLILNIETGEKLSVLCNDKNIDQGSFSGMFMDAIELDKANGKLIQLFNQRYTEVDLESRVVTQKHIDDLKERGLQNMSHFVFDSEHIYFTDKNHQTLGALNRSTLKIDWTHELSQEEVSKSEQPRFGRELKLKDGKLYVLDNKHTLHIFEKKDQFT